MARKRTPPEGVDRTDLRLRRLLAVPRLLKTENDAASILANAVAARPGAGGALITNVFSQPGPSADIRAAVEDLGPLLEAAGGAAVVADLHIDPQRQIEAEGHLFMLGAYEGAGGTSVVEAEWTFTRDERQIVVDGKFVDLRELVIPSQEMELARRLRDLASASGFDPWRPRIKGILVPSAAIARDSPDLLRATVAAAAVSDVSLDVIAPGDPNSLAYVRQVDRALERNSHHLLVVVLTGEDAGEKWLWNRFKSYQERHGGRSSLAVLRSDGPNALDMAAASFDVLASGSPPNPCLAWGPDALARVSFRINDAFALGDTAVKHLRRNPYPHVERMITHLERLADWADAWHSSPGDQDGRLVDWAHAEFKIEIALFDSTIANDTTFTFDGKTLSNIPHVKVDDVKDLRECGRIYFGMDTEHRRVVVYHVGIHDRS